MKDKSLSILLATAFGLPGLAVLLLAVLQMLAFFRTAVKADEGKAMIEVPVDERP